jgi:hypothetical protein
LNLGPAAKQCFLAAPVSAYSPSLNGLTLLTRGKSMHHILSSGALALGLALAFAAPVYAEEESQGTEQAETQSNPNDRICRRVRVTGTHIPQRICMSRAEWADLREQSQEELRERNADAEANVGIDG